MNFREYPFFDNHTHLLNLAKNNIKAEDLALNFLHGFRDEIDEDGTLVASEELVYHMANMGVVKTLVNYMSKYLNCEATLEDVIAARNAATQEQYEAYIKALYDEEHIIAEVLDCELSPDNPKLECIPVPLVCLFRYEDVYFSLLKSESSFEALWNKLEASIRDAIKAGFRGLKGHVGEKFTMAVRDVSPEQAEMVFAKAKEGEYAACEDVYFAMFAKLLLLCAELDITIHLHSGCTGLRSNPDVPQLDPLLMVPFLKQQRFMKTKIVFLHQSFPYTRNAALMAFSFPNVYLDLSWTLPWNSICYNRCLEDALNIAPHSKILFGTGQHHYPEMVWMASKIAKQALKEVLEQAVESGTLSEAQAIQTAKQLLFENGMRLYGLNK